MVNILSKELFNTAYENVKVGYKSTPKSCDLKSVLVNAIAPFEMTPEIQNEAT